VSEEDDQEEEEEAVEEFAGPPPSILKIKTQDESLSGNAEDKNNNTKSVSFDSTEIREYPMLLDTSRHEDGMAMFTIGWDILESNVMTVQDFDRLRKLSTKSIDHQAQKYHPSVRAGILLRAGYKLQDLQSSKEQHDKLQATAMKHADPARIRL